MIRRGMILPCALMAMAVLGSIGQAFGEVVAGKSLAESQIASKPRVGLSSEAAEAAHAIDPLARIAKLPLMEKENYVGIGLYGELVQWYEFPGNVKILGPLELEYFVSHSTTLSEESTLTLWFNDQPLKSMVLGPDNVAKTVYRLTIPRDIVKVGPNSLRCRTYCLANIVRPCQDMNNPANWAVIHKESFLEVRYKTEGMEDLVLFPKPYVDRGTLAKFPLAIVLPENPNPEELKAAAAVVQYLGNVEPFSYDGLRVFLGGAKKAELCENFNVISVGDRQRNVFQDKFQELPPKVLESLDVGKGLLVRGEAAPGSGKTFMLISGHSPAELFSTAQTLTYPELVARMKGPYALVDTLNPLAPKEVGSGMMNPTFKDLKILTTKLTGVFETRAAFYYAPPLHWQLLHGAALNLEMSYSALLDPNASIVSVLINDRPIKSFKLKGAEGVAKFTVTVPDEMLEEPFFYVVVVCTLALQSLQRQEDWCLEAHHDKAWALIHNTSNFYTPHVLKKTMDFNAFPSLFMDDLGMRPVTIVLRDQPTVAEYEAAFNVIYCLGSSVPADTRPHFEILTTRQITPSVAKEKSLTLIGPASSHPLIVKANRDLPLPFDLDSGRPTKTGIDILPNFLKQAAVLEITKSPWSNKENIFVVSAPDVGLIQLATRTMLNREKSSRWRGNVTLLNEKDQWYCYSHRQPLEKKERRVKSFYVYVWIGTVVLLASLIGFLLYRRARSAMGDPFAGS